MRPPIRVAFCELLAAAVAAAVVNYRTLIVNKLWSFRASAEARPCKDIIYQFIYTSFPLATMPQGRPREEEEDEEKEEPWICLPPRPSSSSDRFVVVLSQGGGLEKRERHRPLSAGGSGVNREKPFRFVFSLVSSQSPDILSHNKRVVPFKSIEGVTCIPERE